MTTPAPSDSPDRRARARPLFRDLRDLLVSLRFTVVLLVFSMVLVFVATLDQVNLGIWAVQEKYFRAFVVYTQVGGVTVPAFPGGYTVGGLLLANLIAAHVYRFAFNWRKAGIVLTHLGLIVLLVGELLTGLWQQDYHMRLDEGETKNYAESFRHHELVLIAATDPAVDDVVAVPEELLAAKTPVQHPKLPFRIITKAFYPNSSLHMRRAEPAGSPGEAGVQATAGLGEQIAVAPMAVTHRPDERNVPSAIVELAGADGSPGTFLVSVHLANAQTFTHAGRTWKIALRVQRAYYPFSLTLLKFSHDRYPGTEIPKNFSSRLRLTTPAGTDDREVLVFMNNPLRYAGLTFYQAGFENNDRTSILQVVRNPSWLIPYVACAMMTLGLVLQFGLHLVRFVTRRRNAPAPAPVAAPAETYPKNNHAVAAAAALRRPAGSRP